MTASLLDLIVARLDRSGVPNNRFPDGKREYWAHCPFHQDKHATNFSVSAQGYHCFACGAKGGLRQLADKLGLPPVERNDGRRWHDGTANGGAAGNFPAGYTLEQYAHDKALPIDFLQRLGLCTRKYNGRPAVRIPYCDATGSELYARHRIAATGDKFRWNQGAHATLYGLERLDRARGYVYLVEGESDAQTLWLYGEPALGVPGATTWRAEWAEHVAGLTVYVWQEPDQGGATFARSVTAALPAAKLLRAPQGRKDVSDCHLHGDDLCALLAELRKNARDGKAIEAKETAELAAQARRRAGKLASEPRILDRFLEWCRGQGLVGEEKTVKLLYLALTSRLLDHPVSVAVKGPSSGGKSFTVETVLNAFPAPAYYALSAMSEHSLAYSTEPISHRHLVLYEAAGMGSDFASYLMRSLLSEGCIRYDTVEKKSTGLEYRSIEREGPAGLIITTTAASLHPENETRLFSVTVQDTPQQTAAVLAALAERAMGGLKRAGRNSASLDAASDEELARWHGLQEWLALGGKHEVVVPFARQLADLTNSCGVRLRRDFGATLSLIQAHAMLHQETRLRDHQGRIVATLEDYAAVYELVINIVSEGVQAAVRREVREVVEAVRELDRPNAAPVNYKQVGAHLGIDLSAARRRCEVAIKDGYLVNRQDKRGQPAMLGLGDPLPEDHPILPRPEALMSPTPDHGAPSCQRAAGEPNDGAPSCQRSTEPCAGGAAQQEARPLPTQPPAPKPGAAPAAAAPAAAGQRPQAAVNAPEDDPPDDLDWTAGADEDDADDGPSPEAWQLSFLKEEQSLWDTRYC